MGWKKTIPHGWFKLLNTSFSALAGSRAVSPIPRGAEEVSLEPPVCLPQTPPHSPRGREAGARGFLREGLAVMKWSPKMVPASAGSGRRTAPFLSRPGGLTRPRAPEPDKDRGTGGFGAGVKHVTWFAGSFGRSRPVRQGVAPSWPASSPHPVAAARNPPLLLSYLAMHYPQCICKMICKKKVSCSHNSYKDCFKNSDFVIDTFYLIGKKYTYFSWFWDKTLKTLLAVKGI